jgi:hypothetical protein
MTDVPVEGNAPIMSSAEMARECEDLAADVATAVAPGARSKARVDLARIEGPKTQFKFEVTVTTESRLRDLGMVALRHRS